MRARCVSFVEISERIFLGLFVVFLVLAYLQGKEKKKTVFVLCILKACRSPQCWALNTATDS